MTTLTADEIRELNAMFRQFLAGRAYTNYLRHRITNPLDALASAMIGN